MYTEIFIFLPLGALVLSVLITKRLLGKNAWLDLVDTPVERSLHIQPTPNGGGIAILTSILVLGALATYLYPGYHAIGVIALCILIVGSISLYDDLKGVRPAHRLIVHSLAAILLIISGFKWSSLELPGLLFYWPETVVSIVSYLFIVWLINLYNFMDGIDGFAGGMAVIGFGTFSIFGFIWEEWYFMLLSMIIASSAAGFLVFNFPPAKIFMGDIGSSVLGLLVAVFALWGTKERIFPLWISILIFSPFIVDATVTLIKRAINKERIWEAHNNHFYQKLTKSGWGHKKTVLVEYFLMIMCSASALFINFRPATEKWLMLLSWVLVYIALIIIINKKVHVDND